MQGDHAVSDIGAPTAADVRADRAAAQFAGASRLATSSTLAKRGYAPVNGLDLYYEIHGTGEPLVLLHGGLLTIDLGFAELLPPLAQNRRVIAVELQAHGHTADVDRPLIYEQMADDVAALLAFLGIRPTDLFGFSLGGGVAWHVAIQHPAIVRKLIVASAPIRRNGWYAEMLEATAGMTAETAAAMVETPFYEAYAQVAPNPEDWAALVTKISVLLEQDYDWTEDIRSITAPVLYAIGDADSVRPTHALEIFELLGGGQPGDCGPLAKSRLAVFPGTAHSAVLNRTDLLLPIITPFLATPMPEGGNA